MERSAGGDEDTHVLNIQDDIDVTSGDEKTFMRNCILVNDHLESMRHAAELTGSRGPVVLFAGLTGCGKSVFLRKSLEEAVKKGRTPLLVDTNLGKGYFLPATMGLCLVDRDSDDESNFSVGEPELFLHGSKSPEKNIFLYEKLITKTAAAMTRELQSNPKIRSSGAMVATCGWVAVFGHSYVRDISKTMGATVVVIIGEEKIYERLPRHLAKDVQILFMPALDASVPRSERDLERVYNRIHSYFSGLSAAGKQLRLARHSIDVHFKNLSIFTVINRRDGVMLLPIRYMNELTEDQLLAVSSCLRTEKADALLYSVQEFICITKINRVSSTLTLLFRNVSSPIEERVIIATELRRFHSAFVISSPPVSDMDNEH